MDCDIKITVGTIWFGLDCMRACMSRCFESELQDKTLLASDDLGDGSLILFFHSRWLVAFLHDATVKHVKDVLSTTPGPPTSSFPLSAPQPGMMREGAAEAKVRARVRR